jgi:hypothetical protein
LPKKAGTRIEEKRWFSLIRRQELIQGVFAVAQGGRAASQYELPLG